MLKIVAILALMLIGSAMWAAGLSCDSCGSECAAACGTRHFRSCCFNYLRRKRGPDSMKLPQHLHDFKPEVQKSKLPAVGIEDIPDIWGNMLPSDYRFNPFDDTLENRLQAMYDA